MLSTLPVGAKSPLQGTLRILVLEFSRGENHQCGDLPSKNLAPGMGNVVRA
jgi:hypothetical protein